MCDRILVVFVTNNIYCGCMSEPTEFEITEFLPYLLNRAADNASISFQKLYKSKYGMLQTEWRVMFHLGRFETMTAKQICERAGLHKTKVSRAVRALELKRFLTRDEVPEDRRNEQLQLTKQGRNAYKELAKEAEHFEQKLIADFSTDEQVVLKTCLKKIVTKLGQ